MRSFWWLVQIFQDVLGLGSSLAGRPTDNELICREEPSRRGTIGRGSGIVVEKREERFQWQVDPTRQGSLS